MPKNEHYFLNLSMPAAQASFDAGHGAKGSTIATTMPRNGVDFGIRVSGLDGRFTAPANFVEGLLFPRFESTDAAPDLRDSAITETLDYSCSMYTITEDENNTCSIPTLDCFTKALKAYSEEVSHV